MMSYTMIRGDIAHVKADCIVNTTSAEPVLGGGADYSLHTRAGKKLLEARRKFGKLKVGDVCLTKAYDLDAKYVVHVVTPVWHDERDLETLKTCYRNAFDLAIKHHVKSIAFPLMASGTHGFAKEAALNCAVEVFEEYLRTYDLMITLVVFDDKSFAVSKALMADVQSYVDAHYVREALAREYKARRNYGSSMFESSVRIEEESAAFEDDRDMMPMASYNVAPRRRLEDLMKEVDDTFSEALLKMIDRRGLKDSDVYKKANIDRKLFSKIRTNKNYQPSKTTVLAFAIALELSLDETKDLLNKAGYALTHSQEADIIVEYFIVNENYNLMAVNEVLFMYHCPLLGSH